MSVYCFDQKSPWIVLVDEIGQSDNMGSCVLLKMSCLLENNNNNKDTCCVICHLALAGTQTPAAFFQFSTAADCAAVVCLCFFSQGLCATFLLSLRNHLVWQKAKNSFLYCPFDKKVVLNTVLEVTGLMTPKCEVLPKRSLGRARRSRRQGISSVA